jgi:dihydroorotate dehydrogenase (NAD+) catalytic subunit
MSFEPDHSIEIFGVKWKTPLTTASGTFELGDMARKLFDLNDFGAITLKSLTLNPREGNPPPRIAEVDCGLLNSIGLANPGINYFLEQILPKIKSFGIPLILSIAGDSIEEYVSLAQKLSKIEGLMALEVNMSCPNASKRMLEFGSNPKDSYFLVKEICRVSHYPIIAKLTPNCLSIQDIALAVEEAGANAVSLINTLIGMDVDLLLKKPITGLPTAGLSGPAIRTIALRMVWEVYKVVKIPIIGMGGIIRAEDAIKFFLVGASAVALGTVNFIDFSASKKIINGLDSYLRENSFASLKEIIGLAHKSLEFMRCGGD